MKLKYWKQAKELKAPWWIEQGSSRGRSTQVYARLLQIPACLFVYLFLSSVCLAWSLLHILVGPRLFLLALLNSFCTFPNDVCKSLHRTGQIQGLIPTCHSHDTKTGQTFLSLSTWWSNTRWVRSAWGRGVGGLTPKSVWRNMRIRICCWVFGPSIPPSVASDVPQAPATSGTPTVPGWDVWQAAAFKAP